MNPHRPVLRLLALLGLLTSSLVAQAQTGPRLNIVSWNLEWLADPAALNSSGFWAKCKAQQFSNLMVVAGLPPCSAVAAFGRTAAAYENNKLAPLRAQLSQLAQGGMDLLAVQEVGSPAALQAVLPEGWRVACFSQTPQAQNVGFALRDSSLLQQAQCKEFKPLSLPKTANGTGRLRPGLEFAVSVGGPAGPKLSLLNVHLKASCSSRDMSSQGHQATADCASLQRQVPVLEDWIHRQADAAAPFMIIGDWNRDLEREIQQGRQARTDGADPASPAVTKRIRYLWPEINDSAPANSRMRLVRVDRSAAQASGCHVKLDQAAASQLLLGRLQASSLVGGDLGAALLAGSRVSDHCPLRIQLQW